MRRVTAEERSTSPEDVVILQRFTPSRSRREWALIGSTAPLWADFEREPFSKFMTGLTRKVREHRKSMRLSYVGNVLFALCGPELGGRIAIQNLIVMSQKKEDYSGAKRAFKSRSKKLRLSYPANIVADSSNNRKYFLQRFVARRESKESAVLLYCTIA
jgi:hypothetical protein